MHGPFLAAARKPGLQRAQQPLGQMLAAMAAKASVMTFRQTCRLSRLPAATQSFCSDTPCVPRNVLPDHEAELPCLSTAVSWGIRCAGPVADYRVD